MSMAQDNPQQTSTDPQSSSQVPPSTSSQPSATPAIQADTNQQSDSSLATPPSPADTMLTSQSSLTSRLEAATDPASLDSLGVSSGSDRSGQQSGSDGNSSGKTLVVAPGVAAAVTDPSLAKLAEDENVARQWQQVSGTHTHARARARVHRHNPNMSNKLAATSVLYVRITR